MVAEPPWRLIRSMMLPLTPRRSSPTVARSKPLPRSRTKTSTRVVVDLGVHVDLIGTGVLGGVDHGLPRGPDQGLQRLVGVAVTDGHDLDRHPALVLDLGGGGEQGGLEGGLGGLVAVQPATQLALLPAGQLLDGLGVVGLALDQGEGLQHGVVQMRRHVGPGVGPDALRAGLVQGGPGTVEPRR